MSDILFIEGDKFFRELTQYFNFNVMPITSNIELILKIMDFLLDETITLEIF